MLRRQLLHFGAFTLGGLPVSLVHAQGGAQKKFVVVLLRGAVDGLSVVAPFGEREYAASRPQIALPPPGADDGLIRLDSLFGLHPALAPLKRHWDGGQLAFVHASGSPDPTRSHFDAQDYFESGTPGRKSTPDGWMNRLLMALPGEPSPTRAISQGSTPPRIFAGTASVASLGLGPDAMQRRAIDDPQLQAGLARLYAHDPQLGSTLRDTTEGRGEMARSMAAGDAPAMDPSADAGAPSARSFAADARRLGTLIRKDPHTQLAFTAVGGWDSHVNQGAGKGQLANRLASLGAGLDALASGLGDSLKDTVIVVASEFGRTLRQNGNGGTDHGRGNVMWLLGGPVAGGQVLGEWPGLDRAALADGRDLAVRTDFRQVLAPLLQRHLGLTEAALATVFPQGPQTWRYAERLLRG
ncbi:DUF1501 domain-containing protein [Pelomonas aquatica]|jgi:uncharacterized protein (DUF1501 family)|uniref:DUF1501 domain-containing protein n=1 Tax=Pelomonas aquatica TaxID=431058 RepID=A0A9X4LIE6_9BURK|nr:DUF1501 domain-containing protein [Pelomonas aquatica]MCY4756067.1 DUF1501 domain-containing protein [Pelomonas aquatica]MDG0864125.1 DUF1501 domain-containing protein [Pelomonas aquatica]